MIQYIKVAIASLISGIFSVLPVSSAAHYSLLNSVLHISYDSKLSALYFSVISLVCSLFMLFYVRKIQIKAVSSLFARKKSAADGSYKKMIINTLISLVAAVVMFIPYSKGKLLLNMFDNNLSSENTLVTAFCCIAGGLLLLLAVRYRVKAAGAGRRQARAKDVVRFTLYQIPANIFPGFSHIASGASSLIISDIDQGVIIREMYLYTSWPMLILSVARIVSCFVSDVKIDYVAVAVCAVFAAIACAIVFPLINRLNIKKLFLFFAVYSIILGIFMIGITFI